MKKNVGMIDRVLRALAGVVLIALVFIGPQTAWGWIGIIPLATAFISWCPLYTLIGIKTCKPDKAHNL
jgi:hypothetical protein